MSHLVESMAYTGQTPWHGLGLPVGSNMSPKKMMEAAGLDWTVEKHKIMTEKKVIIPDRLALIRSSDKKPLGLCSPQYIPIQNESSFDFFNKFVKAGRMAMETAGSLDGGKKVWGLARMKAGDFELANNDVVEGYLLMANSHVPGMKMSIRFTPIRVVCNNTLTMALGNSVEQSVNGIFSMSHKREFDDNAKEVAEQVLGLSAEKMKFYKETAEFLSTRKASESMMERFFSEIYQPTADFAVEGAFEANQTVRKLKEIVNFQPGNDKSPGSWWSAFNAITYFHDHVKGRSPESRLNVSWFGMGARNKEKALDLAVQYAKDSRKIRS